MKYYVFIFDKNGRFGYLYNGYFYMASHSQKQKIGQPFDSEKDVYDYLENRVETNNAYSKLNGKHYYFCNNLITIMSATDFNVYLAEKKLQENY